MNGKLKIGVKLKTKKIEQNLMPLIKHGILFILFYFIFKLL